MTSVLPCPRRRSQVGMALAAAAIVTQGFLLGGCGTSGFRYVSHRQSSGPVLYFKIPDGWKVYDQRQIIDAANGALNGSQISQLTQSDWLETFDGSSHGSVTASESLNGSVPAGFVEARRLSLTEQDGFSLASLRTELLPSDPLNPPNPSPYVVLHYTLFTRSGGLRGSHLVVDIKDSNGAVSTFNQMAMIYNGTNYIYLIALSCRASCYAANQGLIGQILDSWNVRER